MRYVSFYAAVHIVMFLTGLVSLLVGRRMTRRAEARARRAEEPKCGGCQYIVKGVESDRCPECGSLFLEVGVDARDPTGIRTWQIGVLMQVIAFGALWASISFPLMDLVSIPLGEGFFSSSFDHVHEPPEIVPTTSLITSATTTAVYGCTTASKNGDAKRLADVLDLGFDPNGIDHGVPLLLLAAGSGDADTVAVLLENGADATATDWLGRSAFNWINLKSPDAAAIHELLNTAGARLDVPAAACHGLGRIVERLLEQDPSSVNLTVA